MSKKAVFCRNYRCAGTRPCRRRGGQGLFLSFLWTACLLTLFLSGPAGAQDEGGSGKQKALILYSFNDQYIYTANVRRGLAEGLRAIPENERPSVYEEQLDLGRLGKAAGAEALAKYLATKYASVKLDMVITESLPAAELLSTHPRLFSGVPRLFFNLIGKGNMSGISQDASFSALSDGGRVAIATILHVLPKVHRIVVVGDKRRQATGIFGDLKESSRAFGGRVKLEFWDDLTFDELYEKAGSLPRSTAILYLGMSLDRKGAHTPSSVVGEHLGWSASVPVFGVLDSHLRGGVLGGFVRSGEKEGRLMSRVISAGSHTPLRLTREELKEALTGYFFDDRQLRRWGIPDKRLPPGSVILNREKSLWGRYRGYVLLAFAAFALETVLVISLVRLSSQRRRALGQLAEVNSSLTKRTAELGVATERAEHANVAKSAFLANMSHELRSPMNAILGFSELMENDSALDPGQRENLAIIRRSGEYLLSLIDDVLDMAKIEAGRVKLDDEPVDLHVMVRDIMAMMQDRAAKKGLDLLLDQSADFPRVVRGDGVKLKQVIINLLTNAVKFTEKGGVTLRLRFAGDGGKEMISFEVEDTGTGISREDLEEIFNAFVQVGKTSPQKGTGLGLAITKQFVKLMGGTIGVESEPGKGSVFRVDLPVRLTQKSPAEGSEKVKARPNCLAPGEAERRILIVEDQAENRLLLRRLLEGVGFHVRVAENGAEGVRVFQDWKPHFIWMDRRMPVMDGVEATRAIRELEGGRDVTIVAVTASALVEHKEEILSAGMDDLVRKPYRGEEIFECMRRHLGVRYLYEQPAAPAAEGDRLDPSALENLPGKVRDDLADALIRADTDHIARIIQEIREQNVNLSESLARLVAGFDYMPILKVLEECSTRTEA